MNALGSGSAAAKVPVPLESFSPIAMSRLEGSPVVRSPQQLRLHRALEEVGWTGVMDDFNEAARLEGVNRTV